jgi:hypothetical protein
VLRLGPRMLAQKFGRRRLVAALRCRRRLKTDPPPPVEI